MAEEQDNRIAVLFVNAPKRFVQKTCDTGDCVIWTGATLNSGYGSVWCGGRTTTAHRAAYFWEIGPIHPDLDVMHTCDNRLCVNPRHLLAGSRKQNMEDCVAKERQVRGERNGQAKLTDDTVRWMRHAVANGMRQADVCRALGVSPSVVSQIVKRIRWSHVA